MTTTTFATLFAGGGLADLGLIQAGWSPLWAIERDPAIAAVYRANIGDHVIVNDVRLARWRDLPRPDAIWASPPCQIYSPGMARCGGMRHEDLSIADAIGEAVRALKPSLFILENVVGFQRSQAMRHVRAALDALGYWSRIVVLDAADVGTPQTRRRMFLLARRDAMLPLLALNAPRYGWMTATSDLVPSLPPDALPHWAAARGVVLDGEPFLLDGVYTADGRITRRLAHEPAMTVTATSGSKRPWRIWDGAMLRRVTPRMLARLQVVPDAYRLPDAAPLACRIIGNGVPPPLAHALACDMGGAP